MPRKNEFNLERNAEIFKLWDEERLTYAQIAEREFACNFSLSYIRRIIYLGPARLSTEFEKKCYKMFRIKFLELQNVNAAILFVHKNQPSVQFCERTIRNSVNIVLEEKQKENKRL